jgi:hypothetical protein
MSVSDEAFDAAQSGLDPYQLQMYIDDPKLILRDMLMNVAFQNLDLYQFFSLFLLNLLQVLKYLNPS